MKVKIFNAYDLVIFETWIEIQVSGSDIRIKLPNAKKSKEILKDGDALFPEDILNTIDDDLISVMCVNWSPVISKFLLGEIQELEEIDVQMGYSSDSVWYWENKG